MKTALEGFRRCPTCAELKGELLYRWRGDPEPVLTLALCRCSGIPCTHCKKNRMHRPISNRYDEASGNVRHVPYFMHAAKCRDCRKVS